VALGDKITVVIDVVTKSATAGLKDFKSAVGEAQGFTGKLKAGVGSLKDTFGSALTSTAGLAAGVVAAGVGAVKAAGQFSELVKRAIDLGKATGLSTEQASRWIAVADDFGIQAEDLQTGLGRIAKTLDAAVWDKYGIATRDASGSAKSANDIFLQSLDMLGKITNDTERARVGNELFGKGYANIAPIIGNTRAEYEKMLSAVDGGQVITSGEAKRAEKWREAQDKLSDATGDLTLAFGNMAVAAAPLLDFIAGIVQKTAELVDIAGEGDISKPLTQFSKVASNTKTKAGDLVVAFDKLASASGNARSPLDKTGAVLKTLFGFDSNAPLIFDNYKKAITELAQTAPEEAGRVVGALTELVLAAEKAGDQETLDALSARGLNFDTIMELGKVAAEAAGGMDKLGWSAKQLDDDASNLKVSLNLVEESTNRAKDALKRYQDQVKGRHDLIDLVATLDDTKNKLKALTDEYLKIKAPTEDQARKYFLDSAQAADDAQEAAADYLDTVDGISDTQKKTLLIEFRADDPAAFLNGVQRAVDSHGLTVGVTTRTVSGPQDGPNTGPRGAGNTTVNLNIHAPFVGNPVEFGRIAVDAIRSYVRAGGRGLS
jgi:hypothetical protein